MPSPYKMTVDLNVLDHLGINLYSPYGQLEMNVALK